MTVEEAKAIVQVHDADAHERRYAGNLVSILNARGFIIGVGATENEAWIDAARKMEGKDKL
jgi:hypothetical protein